MTTHKTYILVEIDTKEPIKKTVAKDLPSRLARSARETIEARDVECVDVVARIVDEPKKD